VVIIEKDISDIVKVIGDRLTLNKDGPTYKAVCPFHIAPLEVRTLIVDPVTQSYVCMKCHAGGDVAKFLKEYEAS
jgi:DNA primase